jgi:hypothetical protein
MTTQLIRDKILDTLQDIILNLSDYIESLVIASASSSTGQDNDNEFILGIILDITTDKGYYRSSLDVKSVKEEDRCDYFYCSNKSIAVLSSKTGGKPMYYCYGHSKQRATVYSQTGQDWQGYLIYK